MKIKTVDTQVLKGICQNLQIYSFQFKKFSEKIIFCRVACYTDLKE